MATTTHLALTLVDSAQAQKEITVNTALSRIDAVLNTGAKDKDLATPPGSPAAGDVYIVAASPTGAWAGQANAVAYFDQTWKFITPNEGMGLWVSDKDAAYVYTGSAWASACARTLSVQSGGSANSSASGSGSDQDHTPTYTIPANFLGAGKALRITAHFKLVTGSAAPNLTFKLKMGSTTIYSHTAVTPANNLTSLQIGLSWIVQATSVPSASSNIECAPLVHPNAVANTLIGNTVTMPVSVATNASITLKMSTQWSAAGTGTNTATLSQFIVEALN